VKPSIYNEYEALTREAQDFEDEIERLLRPVFQQAQERFLVRDIKTMITDVVSEMAAVHVIKNAMDARAKLSYCPGCGHRWIEHRNGKCTHNIGEVFPDLANVVCGCERSKDA